MRPRALEEEDLGTFSLLTDLAKRPAHRTTANCVSENSFYLAPLSCENAATVSPKAQDPHHLDPVLENKAVDEKGSNGDWA